MKILFLGNKANRDGAPLRLAEILKYIKETSPSLYMDLFLLSKGTDFHMYLEFINKLYIKDSHSFIIRAVNWFCVRFLGRPILEKEWIKKIKRRDYRLFYCNSVVCLPDAVRFKKATKGAKLILHLRELDTVCESVVDIRSLFTYVDEFNVISVAVRNMLISRYHIDEAKINLTYSGTHLPTVPYTVKSVLDNIVIGSCGNVFWRKGVEYFMQVAAIVCRKYPHVEFQWLGNINDVSKRIYGLDIAKLGLENNFHFLGASDHVFSVMKNWFLFLSTAKEEALGVSVIEAGSLGVPIIAFDKSGGPKEILENGGGELVPYLDVNEMANKVEEYINDRIKYDTDSSQIIQGVKKFDILSALPKIDYIIKRNLNG